MEDDGGLLNIALASPDESNPAPPKAPRDYQSEEAFRQVKATWKPTIEGGEIWKSLNLPIDNPSKPESQTILHSIEELYFLKRYDETLALVEKALMAELQDDFKKTLENYRGRCRAKVTKSVPASRTS